MSEAPDIREQEDCPGGEFCDYACDQHIESDDEFWGRLLGDDDPCAPGKDWISAAFTSGPIDMTEGER
jgi:hypothetical protein